MRVRCLGEHLLEVDERVASTQVLYPSAGADLVQLQQQDCVCQYSKPPLRATLTSTHALSDR